MHTTPIYELEYTAKTLAFYTKIGRAMTPEELWRAIPPSKRPEDMEELYDILDMLEGKGFITQSAGMIAVQHLYEGEIPTQEKRKKIESEKWEILLKHRELFSHIPFLDFALVSGSLALGNARESSDFDITIGARRGRIFTTRFFTLLTFGIRGLRRRPKDGKDKFCFPHFVAPDGYRLMGPHTFGWHQIYQNLIPIYGNEDAVIKFFKANDWVERAPVVFGNTWMPAKKSVSRIVCEVLLTGPLGSIFEWIIKKVQLAKIKKQKDVREREKGARIYLRDDELECHLREPEFRTAMEEIDRHLKLLHP